MKKIDKTDWGIAQTQTRSKTQHTLRRLPLPTDGEAIQQTQPALQQTQPALRRLPTDGEAIQQTQSAVQQTQSAVQQTQPALRRLPTDGEAIQQTQPALRRLPTDGEAIQQTQPRQTVQTKLVLPGRKKETRAQTLCDKYKPATLRDVIGNQKAKDALETWFACGATTPVLLCGPVGIGKSSLASAFIRSKGLVVRDCRSLPGELVAMIDELLYSKTGACGIIIDDFTNMDAHERTDILRMVKKRCAIRHMPVLFIIADDFSDKSLEGFKKVCTVVRMFKPSFGNEVNKDVRVLLQKIMASEKIVLSARELKRVEQAGEGDFRAALNALHFYVLQRDRTAVGGATRDGCLWNNQMDKRLDSPFDGATVILRERDRVAAESLMYDAPTSDMFMVKLLVHENYPDCVSSIDSMVTHAELLSASDVLESHKHYSTIALSMSMLVLGMETHTHRLHPKLRFPSWFSSTTPKPKAKATTKSKQKDSGVTTPLYTAMQKCW